MAGNSTTNIYSVVINQGHGIDDDVRTVHADYYVIEDGFATFKDHLHKQVASFRENCVVSIVRASTQAHTGAGTMTVTVVPRLDTHALERALAEAQEQIKKAARHAPDCIGGSKCGERSNCPGW